jgi:hypothetical protein
MKKITIIFLLISRLALSQTDKLEDLCQVMQLPNQKDSTTFIVLGTMADLITKKSLFFFRQGSLPEPLISYEGGKYYLRIPFDFNSYKEKFHFVIAQKIGTKLIADSTYLAEYEVAKKTGDARFFTQNFIKNNTLGIASQQCNQIINYLVKQPWVDSRKVVFCGGSEGFTVGADLVANKNKFITHAILFSGHAGRRFESMIFNLRDAIKKGEMKAEEGQKEIEQLYRVWEDICKYSNAMDKSYGDSYAAWYSFSTKGIDNLLKINVPLNIAYGTDDNEIAPSLDYLPLDFIAKGKKNLTLKAYPNHNHQFFEIIKDGSGKEINRIYRGNEVFNDAMKWLENQ